MPMPKGIGVIETMIGIPSPHQPRNYDFMRPLFRDKESLDQFDFPVEYMFKDVPKTGTHEDYIKYTLEQMDRFGIEKAVIGVQTAAGGLRAGDAYVLRGVEPRDQGIQ